MIVGVALVSSNLFVIAAEVYYYSSSESLAYVKISELEAMSWLKAAEGRMVVLDAGNIDRSLIPAFAGKTVYLGHAVETIDFRRKQNEVRSFFQQNGPEEAELEFLTERNITHIYFSQAEDVLGSYQPDEKEYLKKEFGNKAVQIYKLKEVYETAY